VQVDPAHTQLGYKISDGHLYLGGVGVDVNSRIEVNENVSEQKGFLLHGFQSETAGGQVSQQLTDARNFIPPQPTLHVTKFITASAGTGSNLPARLSVIDQSFSQIVPEPATQALALFAALGFAVVGRRRATAASSLWAGAI
jgi:hypothetical protein